MASDTRGIVYMLLASFFFALLALSVRLLDRLPVMEVILFRAVIACAICLFGIRRAGISPLGHNRRLLLFRGVAGVISLAQGFYLIQTIPLAAASTLTRLTPIFTTLISIWFVQERVRPVQLVFFLVSFAGVMLVQGFDYRISTVHVLIGIAASVASGFAYSSVRKLGGMEHPLVIMFYFPLICLPVAALWSALFWVQPRGLEWPYLLMMGITAVLGQYFMTIAYQAAQVSRVAIVNYTEVLFAIVLGLVLFGENYNVMTYAGMALVALGVVLNIGFRPKTKAAAA